MTSSFVIKEVAGMKIPDSSLAKAATTLAHEASPDFLFNHALRTYVFGIMAGKKLSMAFDSELLYVGAILHDLGLTKTFEKAERFEVDGADAARDFCLEHNVTPEKAELVWDAIALHSTVGIPPAQEFGSRATSDWRRDRCFWFRCRVNRHQRYSARNRRSSPPWLQ